MKTILQGNSISHQPILESTANVKIPPGLPNLPYGVDDDSSAHALMNTMIAAKVQILLKYVSVDHFTITGKTIVGCNQNFHQFFQPAKQNTGQPDLWTRKITKALLNLSLFDVLLLCALCWFRVTVPGIGICCVYYVYYIRTEGKVQLHYRRTVTNATLFNASVETAACQTASNS